MLVEVLVTAIRLFQWGIQEEEKSVGCHKPTKIHSSNTCSGTEQEHNQATTQHN